MVVSNDNWQSDHAATQIEADGLAPGDPAEAATRQSLSPGAYTFVVTGKDATAGIGLVEIYDISPTADSRLANLSTRGLVGTGESVLISGFIAGDVESDSVVIRCLGPSLSDVGITSPLADPTITVYDSNGTVIAANNNWQDDISASDLTDNGLAPSKSTEAATLLRLPAGAYTTVASGAGGTTGIGLVEIFDLLASTN